MAHYATTLAGHLSPGDVINSGLVPAIVTFVHIYPGGQVVYGTGDGWAFGVPFDESLYVLRPHSLVTSD